MSLTFAEVTGYSAVSEVDFNAIFGANDSLIHQVVIQRHTPNFSLHDSNSFLGNEPFSVASDATKILRAVNDAGVITVDYLLIEDNNQAAPSSWSGATILTSSALPNLAPKVVKQGSGWDIFVLQDDGTMQRYSSVTGTGSWSNTRFGMFDFPNDGTVKFFTYGGGIEIIYYWLYTSYDNNYTIRVADSTVSTFDSDTEIVWFDAPLSLDCVTYRDTIDDSDEDLDDMDIRHALIMSVPLPALYKYTNVEFSPTKQMLPSGGIISFIIRPPIDTVRSVQFSNEHPVQTFDSQTSLQFRGIAHVTGMNSIFDASNFTDTLWIAAPGGDGDINGDDTSHGYTALYYYSSRDNVNWSMDRIVPLTDVVPYNDFLSGASLVRCGNYVYMISARSTLRSPASSEFGTVHPDYSLDITEDITAYNSTLGDMRQTRLTLDNPQGRYNNSLLLSDLGGWSMITRIGQNIDDVDYLFQVAIEDVDSITPHRERPTQAIEIQARDRMAWLADRSQSPDAIIYDNIVTGADNFAALNGQKDSGLRHVATIAGTFSTSDNTLKAISNYKECIELSTFNSLITNGSMQVRAVIPRPQDHALPGETVTNGNNHAYAGFVFHVLDKDNLWYCYYDYWAQGISVGYRKNGVNRPQAFITVSAWFISQASGGLPFTMRIEYRYNTLYIYTLNNIGVLQYQAKYILKGRNAIYSPMQEGGSGLIACGFSDEDTGTTEPEPTVVISDGPQPNVVPSRLLILMSDGRLIRALGTDTGTGSPTYELVAGPGTFSGYFGDSARSICNDPYEPDTIIILDPASIRRVRDVWGVAPVEELLVTSSTPGVVATFKHFVGNLTGSINRKNWFGWLGHSINADDHQSYFYYTTDNFVTIHAVHISTPGPFPDGQMNLIPGLFNTTGKGVLYCQEGTAGTREFRISGAPPQQTIWKSTTWGLTWSVFVMCYPGGGGMNIYYKKRNGSDNTDDTFVMHHNSTFDVPQGYVEVSSAGVMTPFTVTPPGDDGSNRWYYDRHYLAISTDNGLYQAVVNPYHGGIHITDDGWATETVKTVPGNAAGVSGYPPSPNYYVTWNGTGIQMTFDRGDSWWDIGTSLNTWWVANIGPSEPFVIYVYADLAEFYDVPKWNGT